ncbi:MAG: AI-2E family transporter, partial [Rhizobiaceae bacterium]|nr:AI-2E family transporter [Rhizobiaceae bacterium]
MAIEPAGYPTPQEQASQAFRRQVRFWLVAALIIALIVFVFSEILLPFVAGMVLAYFLDPVADRLERLGLSRMMATTVILVAFLVVLTLALVILIPVLARQFYDLMAIAPEYLGKLQKMITDF